jgi:hypothetical protein
VGWLNSKSNLSFFALNKVVFLFLCCNKNSPEKIKIRIRKGLRENDILDKVFILNNKISLNLRDENWDKKSKD